MCRVVLGVILLVLPSPLLAAKITVRGEGHTRIPFEVQGGHVWVQGKLNETDSVWVVIDTGASSSAMDAGVATRLGFEQHGSEETMGAGGSQSSASVSNVKLKIAGLDAHFETLDTVDFGALNAQSPHPLEIVLGAELFEACVVRFDYPAGIIDLWDNAHAPATPSKSQVLLTLIEHHPYVDGVLNLPGREPLRGRFVIDTGSNGGVILAPQGAERNRVVESFPRTLEVVGRGVGGEVHNRIGRAESFSVGDLRFDRPVIVIPDSTGGRFSAVGTMGNIGGQLLNRCRVTFDYAHLKVGFEPAEGFERPFETDMSGLAMIRDSEGFIVRVVNPETPAAEAGMKPGDLVTRIDGKPTPGISPAALRTLMQQEGHRVVIEFRRGTQPQTATLVLRRLI